MKNISFYLLLFTILSVGSCKKDVLNLGKEDKALETNMLNIEEQGLPKIESQAGLPTKNSQE